MPTADVEPPVRSSVGRDSTRLPPIQQKPFPHEMAPIASRPVREHVVPFKEHTPNGNGQTHPSHDDLGRNAYHRIQSQVSLNQAGLEAHKRDIDQLNIQIRDQLGYIQRMEGILNRLQPDVQWLVNKAHERGDLAASPHHSRSEDPAIEMMAKQISTLSGKVSEVDNLKLEVELLKRKLKRYEESGHASQPANEGYNMQRIPSTDQPFDRRVPPPPQPPQYVARPHESPSYRHSTVDVPPHYEPETRVSGWAAVNTNVNKRPPAHSVEESTEPSEASAHSPKRPKLAPLEPRLAYSHPPPGADRMETDSADHRRRDPSNEYSTNTPTFVAYNTSSQSDDSWRPESQRYMGHEAVFAKHGSRPGARPGRPRKHPANPELGTPEWEKPEWSGSQIGADGWYQHTTPGNPIRSGRGGTVTITSTRPNDPYAHTKKTRTKPVRNDQGILIRKDGQPDMRSQSSAANLRKVHARKEQEKLGLDAPHTPSSGLANAPTSASASPENERPRSVAGTSEPSSNTQERHHEIMKQIFPTGVDEERFRKQNEARFFPGGSSPSAKVKQESSQHSVHAKTTPPRDVEMGGTVGTERSRAALERHTSESAGTASSGSPAQTASEGNGRSPEAEAR